MKRNPLSFAAIALVTLWAASGCSTDAGSLTGTTGDTGTLADAVGADGTAEVGTCHECPAIGAAGCESAGVRTCEDKDGDGCREWSKVVACGSGTQCVGGKCEAACSGNDCTVSGVKKCDEGGKIVTCGDYDSDGCLEWGKPTGCDQGLVCANGFCAVSCSSACTKVGAKKCDGNDVVTCGDYNHDGCLEWGDASPCGALVCANGFCATQCKDTCAMVDVKKCEGAAVTTCDDYNADGCLEWGTPVPCTQGQACSSGFCKDTCSNECDSIGKKACELDSVIVCEDYNNDGCLEWGSSLPCAQDLTCAEGSCVSKCESGCTSSGAHKCQDDATVLQCGDFNADGCLQWGNPVGCDQGLICSGGFCGLSCTETCTTVGAKKCDGNDVVVCGDHNQDGCLEWGKPLSCGAEVCADGFCHSQCQNGCTTIDARTCEAGGYVVCGDYNSDGCLEWGTVVGCGLDQVCASGFCKDQCVDGCTVSGATDCSLSSIVTCGDYNDDGCLEWGSPVPCQSPLVCANGFCANECTSTCTTAKAKKCDQGGSVVVCGDYNDDGCLEWGSPVPCQSPLVCAEGNCALQCADGCTPKNAKHCVTGTTAQFAVCDDYNSDGCLEWGTPQTCPGTQVCSSGSCTLSCQNECDTANVTRCNGNGTETCGDYNSDGCLEWGTVTFCETYEECANNACSQKPAPATVLLNEVVYDSTGNPDTDTFVELWGPAGTDLTGYSLVGVNGNGGLVYATIQLQGTIPADGYFVVAHPSSKAAIHDGGDQFDKLVDFQNGPDSIQLRFGTAVVDALGYGSFGGANVFAGEGSAAKDVQANHSLARDASHTDKGDNSIDFQDITAPTPGAENAKINVKPVASLSCPGSGNVGDDLPFDGSASNDPDGTIASYSFDFGDGSPAVSGSSNTANHTFSSAATFTVGLTVTDDGGLTSTATCQLTIGDTKVPTVVFIKPKDNTQVTQGDAVAVLVDPTAAPGRSIASVELFADGVSTGLVDSVAPYAFTYPVPANAVTGSQIALQAKAIDSAGSAGFSALAHLLVKNDPPVASFTVVVTGTKTVTVDAGSSSDTETATADLLVRWDFENDGVWDTTWSTTKTAQNTYAADGKYTVRLEVKDGIGQTHIVTHDITLSSIQYVSGDITTTTWTGTIVVTGDLTVPAGETLTIAEGTSVLFTFIDQDQNGFGDYDLFVNGSLQVNGTVASPVLFTVFNAADKHSKAWGKIQLTGGGSQIQNAIVEYADVGIETRNAASISDTVLRSSRIGLWVQSGAKTVSLANLTSTSHDQDGLTLKSGTVAATGSSFKANGNRGIYVDGGTLNLSLSTVRGNAGPGIEFYKGGKGLVTKNQITGNDREGIRIHTNGSQDPAPVINYNNITGNAVKSARVFVDVNISATTTASYSGTKTSAPWSTPAGETLDLIKVAYSDSDYYNYNYITGYVKKDTGSGTEIYKSKKSKTTWTQVGAQKASTIVAVVSDTTTSSYYGSMAVLRGGFDQAGAVREVSVVTAGGGSVDLRHNYFGVFPKVLDVIARGDKGDANIQGFVGVPFDASWSKGPYFGGETLSTDTAWLGDIYITGDLTLSGAGLSVAAGTNVLFADVDQDQDGVGDYRLELLNATFDVNGTGASPVTFTVYGATKAPAGYQEVWVHGTGTATINQAIFEYAQVGLRLETGDHNLSDVTAHDNSSHGFVFGYNATGDVLSATRLVSKQNGQDGLRFQSLQNLTLDRATVKKNAGDGIAAYSSKTNLVVKNSTLASNTGRGIFLRHSAMAIEYNNIQYNRIGVYFQGSSAGTLSFSNVKYNDREGIFLLADNGSSPKPVINQNNIFGNAVVEAGFIEDPGLSVSTTASYSGTKWSSPWSAPQGQQIDYLRVSYSESDYYNYNYITGYVKKDSGSGTELFKTKKSQSLKVVDLRGSTVTALVAGVSDTTGSSYYGSISVASVFYYLSNDPVTQKPTELSAMTDAYTVDCKSNFWGAFPDPSPRFSLVRQNAIDFQGFIGIEVNGTGPQ